MSSSREQHQHLPSGQCADVPRSCGRAENDINDELMNKRHDKNDGKERKISSETRSEETFTQRMFHVNLCGITTSQ